MKIMFICTGNICRSAMAHWLLKQKLKDEKIEGIEVYSCGIYAQDGDLFIAVDNTSNECYVEEFKTEEDVIKWFNEFEKDDEIEI